MDEHDYVVVGETRPGADVQHQRNGEYWAGVLGPVDGGAGKVASFAEGVVEVCGVAVFGGFVLVLV